MFASLTCIVGGAVLLLVLDLEVTGVSYQLGRVCYINPYKGWGTFWIPLLVITALTLLFQALTMAYCVFIVLRPIYHERTILLRRRQPRTSVEYRLGAKARQASNQTQKILRMQWRPVLIVFMVIFNVVFLSTIFLEAESMYTYPTERFVPWIACLAVSGKEKCMSLADGLGPNENLILAVLVLLAVSYPILRSLSCVLTGDRFAAFGECSSFSAPPCSLLGSIYSRGNLDPLDQELRTWMLRLLPKSGSHHDRGLKALSVNSHGCQNINVWHLFLTTLTPTILTLYPSIVSLLQSGQRLLTPKQTGDGRGFLNLTSVVICSALGTDGVHRIRSMEWTAMGYQSLKVT